MADTSKKLDAGVIDVLYAVVLGEGFFSGVYQIKDQWISDNFELFYTGGQILYRVLLAFFIIILSWIHYRRFAILDDDYPLWEFAIDIVVMIAYMSLLLFIDMPVAYHATIAAIWLCYVAARAGYWRFSISYFVFGLSFVIFFIVMAASTLTLSGNIAEWTRLLMITVAVALFRILDLRYQRKLQAIRANRAQA